jgi:hypothetical protein
MFGAVIVNSLFDIEDLIGLIFTAGDRHYCKIGTFHHPECILTRRQGLVADHEAVVNVRLNRVGNLSTQPRCAYRQEERAD